MTEIPKPAERLRMTVTIKDGRPVPEPAPVPATTQPKKVKERSDAD